MHENIVVKAHVNFKRDDLRSSLNDILCNLISNQFLVGVTVDRPEIPPYTDIINKSYDIFTSQFPVIWHIWKNGILMRITIESNRENDLIIIMPIAPIKIKRGLYSENESIDMAFYIECCLEICENFIIHNLKTTVLIDRTSIF